MISYFEPKRSAQARLERGSHGKNVLIVDDNATNRKLLREVLQAEGYTIVEAEDGMEALAALEREPIDIVVSDVLMPNMDGYSLCSEVRRRSEWKNLFFILYTATDFTANDEKISLELGADRFIRKQGSPSVILTTIEEGVRNRTKRDGKHPDRLNGLPAEKEMREYDTLMIRQLEKNSIELEQARNELRNRTDELAAKNTVLESRTEELARSNAELEQFAYVARAEIPMGN